MNVTARRLACFRVGLAGVLLAQAVSLIGHLDALYGRHGVVAWSVNLEDLPPAVPNLAWFDLALRFVGLPPAYVIPIAFALYVVSLIGLLIGNRPRLAAGLAWLTHTALLISGELSMYGVDRFAQIGLFYCLWFPVGPPSFPLTMWGRGPLDRGAIWKREDESFDAWLGLRILQLHVCIAYTASGVEKALGEQWWNGEAIWRAVIGAALDCPIDCSFLAIVPWIARVLCWMTLLLEAGVMAFVWHPRLRKIWLMGIVGMHLAIALLLNLWTFSAIMIVFDIAAFGVRPAVSIGTMRIIPSRQKTVSQCRTNGPETAHCLLKSERSGQ